jgi:protein arginine kinase activator
VGFHLAELLKGAGVSQEPDAAESAADLQCPQCGFTQADLKKTGRLGCSHCYVTFAEGLGGLLKSMHKGVRHVGKVPAVLREDKGAAERLKGLQKKLEQAIAVENFELAASLRDEIRDLKLHAGPLAPG